MPAHTSTLSLAQAECLSKKGVLHGRNLVYSAPTSGGKSLVAEILAIRRLITTGRTALVSGRFPTETVL